MEAHQFTFWPLDGLERWRQNRNGKWMQSCNNSRITLSMKITIKKLPSKSNFFFYGYVNCFQFTIFVCCAWQVSQTLRSRIQSSAEMIFFWSTHWKKMPILHFIYSLIVFSFGPFVLTSELLAKIPEVCTITESIYQKKTQKCLLFVSIWIQTASIHTWMHSPWNQQAKLEFFRLYSVFRARISKYLREGRSLQITKAWSRTRTADNAIMGRKS